MNASQKMAQALEDIVLAVQTVPDVWTLAHIEMEARNALRAYEDELADKARELG